MSEAVSGKLTTGSSAGLVVAGKSDASGTGTVLPFQSFCGFIDTVDLATLIVYSRLGSSTTSQRQLHPSSALTTPQPTSESTPADECETFAVQNVRRCDSIWVAAAGGLTTTLRCRTGPVCTRTREKSWPNRASIPPRTAGSSGRPGECSTSCATGGASCGPASNVRVVGTPILITPPPRPAAARARGSRRPRPSGTRPARAGRHRDPTTSPQR